MQSALYFFKTREEIGPGWLLDRCEGLPVPVAMVTIDAATEFPMGIQCQGVVFVGLPLPHEIFATKDPVVRAQQIFIRTLVGLQVPYLGIGVGAQLLATAMLGQSGEIRREMVGASEIALTEEGRRDELFGGGPAKIPVVRWPSPTLSLPQRAVLLAGTPDAPDAFRLGECAWAIGPHLEVTPQGFADWLDTFGDDDPLLGHANGPALIAAVTQQQDPQQDAAYAVMNRFIARMLRFKHDQPPITPLQKSPHGPAL